MSRAFVKEDDVGQDALPPARVRGSHPNYITRAGLERLRARHDAALARRQAMAEAPGADDAVRRAERDLAWLREGIETAVVVAPDAAPRDRVVFGATVTVEDEDGRRRAVTLVGEDEAEIGAGRYNWASPLGRALLGAAVGDQVTWHAPNGDRNLEVVALDFDSLA